LRKRLGREDLEDTHNIRDYIRQHISSWYEFAKGPPFHARVSEGDLVLVRGCDKTESWAISVFQQEAAEAGIFFKGGYVTAGSVRVAVKGTWASGAANECRAGPGSSFSPSTALPISQDQWNPRVHLPSEQHQCVFVRVYKARRLPFKKIPAILRAAAEPQDMPMDRSNLSDTALLSDVQQVVSIEIDPEEGLVHARQSSCATTLTNLSSTNIPWIVYWHTWLL
jgi:hypothetical protein